MYIKFVIGSMEVKNNTIDMMQYLIYTRQSGLGRPLGD